MALIDRLKHTEEPIIAIHSFEAIIGMIRLGKHDLAWAKLKLQAKGPEDAAFLEYSIKNEEIIHYAFALAEDYRVEYNYEDAQTDIDVTVIKPTVSISD